MRNTSLIIMSGLFLFLTSCSKSTDTSEPKELRLEINTPVIYSDLMDELVVTVFDSDNKDVTTSSEVLIDGKLITGNRFKTSETKTFPVKARLNAKETDILTFKSIRHEINNFPRKTIMEEFAGAWCGYCARFTYIIDSVAKKNNNIIPISIHSGDGLEYIYVQQIRDKFGISSFPSGYLNRSHHWNESWDMILTELNKKAKVGIALNTSVSNTTVDVAVKVKFDITTSERLNIVVALLEDSLVYPQSNYYNNTPSSPFYQLGNPIQNYRHNNTLRTAATDVFGDLIPLAVQNKDRIWEKNYSLNISGFNIADCKVVAFVQYAENNMSRWGVLNAQVVKVGNIIGFD